MKMSKNYKKLCLALGLTGIIGAGAVTAQSGTQTIPATYRNIQVTYNGVTQPMAAEPFLVNGSTYVPLRAIGDIFGVDAKWEPTSNLVTLTGGAANSNEVAALQAQVNDLTAKLNAANTELAQLKANNNTSTGSNTTSGTNISNAQLKDTENYLNSNFSNELNSKIDMFYKVSLSGNQINVDMTYESKSEDKIFKDLSKSKVESFMKKIGDNVAATHSDVVINGTIEYTKDNEEKATFTRTKTGKYTYNHSFDNDAIKDAIEDEVGSSFSFSGLGVGSLSINNIDPTIRESKTTINVKLYLATNDTFKNAWNAESLSDSSRRSAVSSQLNDIQDAVTDLAKDYDVTISVYYDSESNEIARMDADSDITTNTIH